MATLTAGFGGFLRGSMPISVGGGRSDLEHGEEWWGKS
jgi:hypothetical protein